MEIPKLPNNCEAYLFVQAADIVITAGYANGAWLVIFQDDQSKKECKIDGITTKQMGAIMFLLAGAGEERETDAELTELMYQIAGPIINQIPPECRPVP